MIVILQWLLTEEILGSGSNSYGKLGLGKDPALFPVAMEFLPLKFDALGKSNIKTI